MNVDMRPRIKEQAPIALLTSNCSAPIGVYTDDQRKAAKHREIARHYARPRRRRGRPGIVSLVIRDLQTFFGDKYGPAFPDDDAGRDDLVVLLHYVAQLGDPRAMIASAARWCPWLGDGEYTAMIGAIERKPLRWRADSLACEIGLDHATRTRLGITTIGATDFGKAQRTKRRMKLNNADKRARRVGAGAKPHAGSAEQTAPWLALGISRRTYYRKQANGTVGTDSGTAAYYEVGTKQCHTSETVASGASDSACDGLAPTPASSTVWSAVVDRVRQGFEVAQAKRDTAFAGRRHLHVLKSSKTAVNRYHLHALTTEMGRAA